MKKTNLAKNTLLLSAGTLINKGLIFVMVPFFSRWLSPAEYGMFDVFSIYITLLIPFITMVCSDAVFRLSMNRDSGDEKAFYISNGLMIVVVNSVIAVLLLTVFKCLTGFQHFGGFLILLLSQTFDEYFRGFLRAIQKLNVYAFSKAAGTVAIAVFVTAFVRFADMGLDGILLGYALGYLATDLLVATATKFPRYVSRQHFSAEGVKELLRFSMPLIPNNISWWFINASDRAIVNLFLGASANGIYAIAYKIPNICSSVFTVFNFSWHESACIMVKEKDRNLFFQDVYSKMLNTLLSLCAGMLCCNFFLFDWIFDPRYADAGLYAPILVTAIVFSSLAQFFGGIQISLMRPKENGVTTVIGAVVNLVVHLALIRFIGLYAAALSTAVSNMAVMLMRQIRLRSTIAVRVTKGNLVCIGMYLYFLICCYIDLPAAVSVLNLAVSAGLALYVNREYIAMILEKVKR